MTESDPRRIDLYGATINMEALKLEDKIRVVATQLKEPNMNYQISEIYFEQNSRTKPEHIRELFSAIEQYNKNGNIKNIEKVTLHIEDENEFGSISKLHNLRCPAKHFVLEMSYINDWHIFFKEIRVALDSGTNFNGFVFANSMLFVDDVPEEGFKEFCEYFTRHNNAFVSLDCSFATISNEAMPHLTQLVRKSTAFRTLCVCLPTACSSNIYEALIESTIRTLSLSIYSKPAEDPHLSSYLGKLIIGAQKIEDLTLFTHAHNILNHPDVKYGLKASQSILKFTLRTDDEADLSVLEENESITSFRILSNKKPDNLAHVALRNRKLQNERVRSTIVLLYNIARLNHCTNNNNNNANNDSLHSSNSIVSIVPHDVWALIVSHIKHPGVTLDFGIIARKIFSNASIRRVI